MLNYVSQFFRQNLGSFPHALSLKWSRWLPILFFVFAFLTQVTHYLTAVNCRKNFKTLYRLENSFQEGIAANPVIWLVLSAVRIFLSLSTVIVTLSWFLKVIIKVINEGVICRLRVSLCSEKLWLRTWKMVASAFNLYRVFLNTLYLYVYELNASKRRIRATVKILRLHFLQTLCRLRRKRSKIIMPPSCTIHQTSTLPSKRSALLGNASILRATSSASWLLDTQRMVSVNKKGRIWKGLQRNVWR